jgi:hypothetical protein
MRLPRERFLNHELKRWVTRCLTSIVVPAVSELLGTIPTRKIIERDDVAKGNHSTQSHLPNTNKENVKRTKMQGEVQCERRCRD